MTELDDYVDLAAVDRDLQCCASDCELDADEWVVKHSYVGMGNYGYIRAPVCRGHVYAKGAIPNSAAMKCEGAEVVELTSPDIKTEKSEKEP